MEEKRKRYTEAQKKAIQKYLRDSVDEVKIRIPKGQKEIIKSHASSQGESMNQFVIRAIDETMQREREVTS